MRSYLNIIDITSSREIRAAEFGFYAEKPSFCLLGENECILFERDNIKYIFSLADGSISRLKEETEVQFPAPPDEVEIFLQTLSDAGDTVHTALTLHGSDGDTVLCRFMGTVNSIGEHPLSRDGRQVVFFGYPSPKGLDTPE